MTLPLMPKATAVWLVDNTGLTFEQIAYFCGMHEIEIHAIADGDVASHIVGYDPIANGQITAENLAECEVNPKKMLRLIESEIKPVKMKRKYTPMAKREDRPDAIAWLLKNHPELEDIQIVRLLGTTRPAINSIKNKTHKMMAIIKPRSPIMLGLCTEEELQKALMGFNK